MNNQHTPGPWDTSNHGTGWIGLNREDRCIARVETHGYADLGEEGRANARLIAAAPDLLAALQGLVIRYQNGSKAYDTARAAIAKATTTPQE